MVKNIPHIQELREKYGNNKRIPAVYEQIILEALSHYPELIKTRISFVLKKNHPVPYGTSLQFSDFLKDGPRTYVVAILEKAKGPTRQALFKNLSHEAQLGVLGHELGHILYYEKLSKKDLFKIFFLYVSIPRKREMERSADISAIEHGLGQELYDYALYVRSIKGFLNIHKELDLYCLKPNEILQGYSDLQIGTGV
jgi:hypothetical protein